MFFSLSSTTRTRSPAMTALLHRYREDKPAAVFGLALHPDPATVKLDQAPRQREAEPRAFALSRADVGLLELLEDPFVILGRDARPGVRHRHLRIPVDAGRGDDDAAV